MNYLKERDGDLFSNADLKRLIVPLLIEQLRDWSSDVCSSDLGIQCRRGGGVECVAD